MIFNTCTIVMYMIFNVSDCWLFLYSSMLCSLINQAVCQYESGICYVLCPCISGGQGVFLYSVEMYDR